MYTYILTYQQPYEYDDDSPEGIGDHGISFANKEERFRASDDDDAWRQAEKFLAEGSIIFDHHIDGDGETYTRRFVSLVRAVG